jgi:hypothetical protein
MHALEVHNNRLISSYLEIQADVLIFCVCVGSLTVQRISLIIPESEHDLIIKLY